jgi:hypothetical protein
MPCLGGTRVKRLVLLSLVAGLADAGGGPVLPFAIPKFAVERVSTARV